jgi:MYXO-CTERM domain-containing protein
MQLYDNTASIGTAAVSSGPISSDTRNLGREGRWVQDNYSSTGNEYLAATFDELRASSVARSIDWITTDYNSQSSPSTFIAYTTGAAGEVSTDSHTDVEIVSLEATDGCSGTVVAWQTAFEIDALGFNVYREEGGQRVRLNDSLLPAMGITRGGAYSYQFVDVASADPGRTYWVEEVRFSLDSDWSGPVAPVAGPTCGGGPTLDGPSGGTSGSPTPLSAPAATAADPAAGGCAVGGGTPPSLWALAALLLLLLSRRHRRIRLK